MVYIALSDTCQRQLPFYLAMEEFVARHVDCDDCFFMWQVTPTVIFGRNQLIENEVNMNYCKAHDIKTFRRKSGGGCVYADMKNIMFSYITKDENVNFTFNKYINLIVLVLHKLGIEAKSTGRNDILIDGRKVSGNAFYHIPGRSIVHGTMLYDTDMENMVASITPSDEKLVSKGVKSVRQHIALLKDYTSLSLDEFKEFVRHQLCSDVITLTPNDITCIKEIEKEYLTNNFIYGNNPRHTITRNRRIEGVGEFHISMELKNDIIKDVNIMGDYFQTGDVDSLILRPLKNVHFDKDALNNALPNNVSDIIMNLNKEQLINLIIK